jgi:hypothetical protein
MPLFYFVVFWLTISYYRVMVKSEGLFAILTTVRRITSFTTKEIVMDALWRICLLVAVFTAFSTTTAFAAVSSGHCSCSRFGSSNVSRAPSGGVAIRATTITVAHSTDAGRYFSASTTRPNGDVSTVFGRSGASSHDHTVVGPSGNVKYVRQNGQVIVDDSTVAKGVTVGQEASLTFSAFIHMLFW